MDTLNIMLYTVHNLCITIYYYFWYLVIVVSVPVCPLCILEIRDSTYYIIIIIILLLYTAYGSSNIIPLDEQALIS